MHKKSETFNSSNRLTRSSVTNSLKSSDVAGTSGNETSTLASKSIVVQQVKDTIIVEQLSSLPSSTSLEEADLSIQEEPSEKQGELTLQHFSSPLSPAQNILTPVPLLHHASPITSSQHSPVSSPSTVSTVVSFYIISVRFRFRFRNYG